MSAPHRPGQHGERVRQIGADAYFAILPEWVLWHPELSAGAVRLFATLQRRANESDHAWPSRKWLAERINVSKNTIDRYLAELVAAGAIDKTRRWDPDAGEYLSTLYRLRMVGPTPAAPHVGTRGPTRGTTPSPVAVEGLAPPVVTDSETNNPKAFHTNGTGFANEEMTPERRQFLAEVERRRRARRGLAQLVEDSP